MTTISTHVDAVVLGAGISGLVSASILVAQGARRVLVVDTYDRVGGNHIDRRHGGFTFDVGSFIFQDDSPLLNHFPELLPRYVPIDPSWSKLTPQGGVAAYPFSVRDDVLAAGPLECVRILGSVVAGRLRHRRMHSARDFARFWIGARLLRRSGLEHYMARFCGLPTERIDLRFAERRMLWIAEHARVVTQLRFLLRTARARLRPLKQAPAPVRGNRQLARPREGFDNLYAPAVERLRRQGVEFALGASPESLDAVDGGFRLRLADREVDTERVVSTVPLDHIRELCGMAGDPLPTVTLLSLFFSFRGLRGFAEPILYNFSHGGTWKRLTVYSDFYGEHEGREFFAVEVIAAADAAADGPEPDADAAVEEFRRHVDRNGLFAGDLRLEGTHVLRHAYPIYTDGAGERAEAMVAALRAHGIESFGRQGGFEYQPTARVSTHEAEASLGAPLSEG